MNLYKCKVQHRHGDDCIYSKTLWIEADRAIAAYIKAKELTRNLDDVVYDPEVERYIPPQPHYICTTDQIIKEYGEIIYHQADRDTKFASWRLQ